MTLQKDIDKTTIPKQTTPNVVNNIADTELSTDYAGTTIEITVSMYFRRPKG